MELRQIATKNRLLSSLSQDLLATILHDARLVDVAQMDVLVMEGEKIERVYFPVDSLIGVVAPCEDGTLTEAAIFGWDGCTDMVLIPGHDRASFRSVVVIPGKCIVLRAVEYAKHLKTSPEFMTIILRSQQAMTSQLVYTSAATATQSFINRLARWLLMYQDRVGSNIPLPHDVAAMLLSVNRTYVTQALGQLRETGCISLSRGHITIVDRAKLRRQAGAHYGPAEAEYERILGPLANEAKALTIGPR